MTEGARARRAGNEGRSRVENWESHLPAPQYKVRRRKGGVWAGRKEVRRKRKEGARWPSPNP